MRAWARRLIGLLSVAACMGLACSHALAQCAMCRSAVQAPDDPLVTGINLSVALMMFMPFAVVGSIGTWVVLAYRRADRLAATGEHSIMSATEERTMPTCTEEKP